MVDIARIQEELRAAGIDGWLFYDFHNRDGIAYRVLGLDPEALATRRWFYWIPAEGEPAGLVSKVEADRLDALPGTKHRYLSWQELHAGLRSILGTARTVAMQYSPLANIPYVSVVDAGTIDLIRSFGYEVVSSADLVQTFEAVLDEAAYRSHAEAGLKVHAIKDEAFRLIGEAVRAGRDLTQYEVQQFIVRRFHQEGLTDDGDHPIVGSDEQQANPHFEPTPENSRPIRPGDRILIDLWARFARPGSIYYDITWCGYVGEDPPQEYVKIFDIVCRARDAALDLVRRRFASGEPLHGWEVDDACRSVVWEAGYCDHFIHRTGHSIGESVHGNGVNIDNLETRDDRLLVPGICFSIEPGIYIPGEMAVRTEIDVFITPSGSVEVVGPIQRELVLIGA